jgi:hypothetical protein
MTYENGSIHYSSVTEYQIQSWELMKHEIIVRVSECDMKNIMNNNYGLKKSSQSVGNAYQRTWETRMKRLRYQKDIAYAFNFPFQASALL